MRIENISKLCAATSLILRVSDLEQLEKEYQQIQLKIENGEWIDIPISGIDSHFSNTTTIENLLTNTVQRVMARVKLNNLWFDIRDTSFVVTHVYNLPPRII